MCWHYEAQWERHERKTWFTIRRPNAWTAGGSKCVHTAGCQLRVLTDSPGAIIPINHDLHNSLWQILLSTFVIWDNISPEHFQLRMHEVVEYLPGVLCMMDAIIIFGKSSEEHDASVRAVFRRLEDSDVTLNFEKCGIRADESKVRAIK